MGDNFLLPTSYLAPLKLRVKRIYTIEIIESKKREKENRKSNKRGKKKE